jgi:hypothetical protein
MKGQIVRGLSFGNFNGKTLDEVLAGPKRMDNLAFCQRCGCKLSQYRDYNEGFCCSCQRALNPLFRRTAS